MTRSQRFSKDDFLLRSEFGVDWYMQVDGDDIHIGCEQDCTAVIEANKISQNSGHNGYSADKEWRKAATIPVSIQIKWLWEHGIDVYNPDHAEGVKRLLNSNEYRYLRPFEWQL